MTYYSELEGAADPARRVGWLRRVGQAYRFECVRQLAAGGGRVVDLGCGDASLAHYLCGCGIECDYLGIEAREIEAALPNGARVVVADMFDVDLEPPDIAVCLGGLVDGCEWTDAELKRRALQLVEQMREAERGVLVAVDLDALPEWRQDPRLAGVRAEWFSDDVEVVSLGREELIMWWGGAVDREAARQSVADGPWGPWDPLELAWLAERCGDFDSAARWLAEAENPESDFARLIAERLS